MLSTQRLLLACFLTGYVAPALFSAGPQATPADQIRLLPGFRAELLYSVPQATQGS